MLGDGFFEVPMNSHDAIIIGAGQSGLDNLPLGPWLPDGFTTPVLDTGVYRAALARHRPDRRPMFTALDRSKVIWRDEQREHADAIILATGYRPDLPYLAALGSEHSRGLSRHHRGLGFVGLEWQRSLSSATPARRRSRRHLCRQPPSEESSGSGGTLSFHDPFGAARSSNPGGGPYARPRWRMRWCRRSCGRASCCSARR
ncbi:hypothetical protein [Lentzea fradiae]|uniref:hypothetical protein n=1 Tax=Lentzea fradiae TaxID=200378 RepID=UPI000A9EBFCB|nr:hypothetical protein [Lentzea fradiae]